VVTVHPARPDDALPVAGVHVRSWQAAYRGLLPDEYLDGLRAEERTARYTFGSTDPDVPYTMVAVDAGIVRGFATTGPCRDAEAPEVGELQALYVDPPSWGTGIGRILIEAARSRLGHQGFSTAVLWALMGNERARRFYRLDGWEEEDAFRHQVVWAVPVDETRFRRSLD
jgi:GNAT superfamily N-acetyltransferase